jgi:hypothetical protein
MEPLSVEVSSRPKREWEAAAAFQGVQGVGFVGREGGNRDLSDGVVTKYMGVAFKAVVNDDTPAKSLGRFDTQCAYFSLT